MKKQKSEKHVNELLFEYELEAPPEKVWRAISIPAFREKWLPGVAFALAEPLFSYQLTEIRYSMRDAEPPYLESQVTLQIRPNNIGGTILTIIHQLADARLYINSPAAANDDQLSLLLAA